jgi:hypothetical protein
MRLPAARCWLTWWNAGARVYLGLGGDAVGTVVPLDPGTARADLAGPSVLEDLEEFAARTTQEPFWLDALERPEALRARVAAALGLARRDLEPGRPTEIVEALVTLADRHRLDLPERRALELDAEVMAAWPRDLWTYAYMAIWERWSWRRMPTVGDFRSPVADAIESRRRRYDLLTTLDARLRARTRPQTVPECITALERVGPGVRQRWFRAALRRDPKLTPADRADLPRWAQVVAPRLAKVGLFGPTDE